MHPEALPVEELKHYAVLERFLNFLLLDSMELVDSKLTKIPVGLQVQQFISAFEHEENHEKKVNIQNDFFESKSKQFVKKCSIKDLQDLYEAYDSSCFNPFHKLLTLIDKQMNANIHMNLRKRKLPFEIQDFLKSQFRGVMLHFPFETKNFTKTKYQQVVKKYCYL